MADIEGLEKDKQKLSDYIDSIPNANINLIELETLSKAQAIRIRYYLYLTSLSLC